MIFNCFATFYYLEIGKQAFFFAHPKKPFVVMLRIVHDFHKQYFSVDFSRELQIFLKSL